MSQKKTLQEEENERRKDQILRWQTKQESKLSTAMSEKTLQDFKNKAAQQITYPDFESLQNDDIDLAMEILSSVIKEYATYIAEQAWEEGFQTGVIFIPEGEVPDNPYKTDNNENA